MHLLVVISQQFIAVGISAEDAGSYDQTKNLQ